MDKVINLEEILIKKIEKEAQEKFNAIKVVEGMYIIPTNNICSQDITNINFDNKFYSDSNLVNDIRNIELKENDYISIRCKKEKWNNIKVLELLIVTENEKEDRAIDIKVKSDLSYEDREDLIKLIANENRDKVVFITFHEYHTFESLKDLVN